MSIRKGDSILSQPIEIWRGYFPADRVETLDISVTQIIRQDENNIGRLSCCQKTDGQEANDCAKAKAADGRTRTVTAKHQPTQGEFHI